MPSERQINADINQARDGGYRYPYCGCCDDAACHDAIDQHPNFAAPAKQEG